LVVIFFVAGPLVGGGKESQLEIRAGGAEGWGIINWLASPGGNLLWDLFLLALGIFLTVVILQRYFEHREEMRWLPARQYLYYQLFDAANWLVGLWPRESSEERSPVWYRFGYISYSADELGSSFGREVSSAANVPALYDRVRQFAEDPELLDSFKQDLDNTLAHSAAVFLAREPKLNVLISQLREHISHFEGSLEIYREAQESGHDPAAAVGLGSSAIHQAGITLQMVILTAYQLRTWLASRADTVEPHPTDGG
jgi:hypothetical protein